MRQFDAGDATLCRYQEAPVKTLRSIAMMDGGCPITRGVAFLRQGQIAFKLGDAKRASLWARRARQEEPDNEEVASFLEQLGA